MILSVRFAFREKKVLTVNKIGANNLQIYAEVKMWERYRPLNSNEYTLLQYVMPFRKRAISP